MTKKKIVGDIRKIVNLIFCKSMGQKTSVKKEEIISNESIFLPFTEAQFVRDHFDVVKCLDYIDGDRFVSVGYDKRICIHSFKSGKTLFLIEAHKERIVCVYPINEELFATGDESGVVKVLL